MPIEPYLIGAKASVARGLVDAARMRRELLIQSKTVLEKKAMGFACSEDADVALALWQETPEYFVLPRGYPVPWKGAPVKPTYVETFWRKVRFPRMKRKLWAKQIPAADALVETPGDKTLCLGCGCGKTSIALWYAAERGFSTLIIVDTDFLKDQWIKEIENVFGIPAEKVGVVQGAKWRFGEQFTVAMLPTLRQAGYAEHFYTGRFGTVIVDECHVLGAPQAIPIISRFTAERLGLSATPTRRDGMHPAFLYHMGGLRACYTDTQKRQASRYVIKRLPKLLTDKELEHCMQKWPVRRMNRARFESLAAKSEEWLAILERDIRAAAEQGRNVLVLGGSVEQLRRLQETLTGVETGLVHADVKGEKRQEAFKCRVVLATVALAGKALDIPRLDTLLLLFASINDNMLRQAVGRIDRVLDNDSLVVIYSHVYAPNAHWKEHRLLTAIKQIDPGADIRVVPCQQKEPKTREPQGAGTARFASRGPVRSPTSTTRAWSGTRWGARS